MNVNVECCKVQITTDPRAYLGHGLVGVEVDLFAFDRPPKPFDEDIVPPRALAAIEMAISAFFSTAVKSMTSPRIASS